MIAPTVTGALRWMEVLASLAVVQGTLELLAARASLDDDGTWRWSTLSRELPWLGIVLRYRPFLGVLGVRLLAALLLLTGVRGGTAAALWVTSLLVNARFRGTTNGGSDMMLLVVLTALVVAHAAPDAETVQRAAVLYVAAQSFLSYFIAGVAKLASPAWRNGRAMRSFLSTPHFAVPPTLARVLGASGPLRVSSWGVMAFECAVPLAMTRPLACAAYVTVALGFHLGNAWAFGLNRFVLAWAATWPALLYASSLAP
ncbi:MAG: HTTM domain-containing protein [Gemmatimonadota bacterium]